MCNDVCKIRHRCNRQRRAIRRGRPACLPFSQRRLPQFATPSAIFHHEIHPFCGDRHHRRGVARNALSTTNAPSNHQRQYATKRCIFCEHQRQMGRHAGLPLRTWICQPTIGTTALGALQATPLRPQRDVAKSAIGVTPIFYLTPSCNSVNLTKAKTFRR
jgi:hypothetical protein